MIFPANSAIIFSRQPSNAAFFLQRNNYSFYWLKLVIVFTDSPNSSFAFAAPCWDIVTRVQLAETQSKCQPGNLPHVHTICLSLTNGQNYPPAPRFILFTLQLPLSYQPMACQIPQVLPLLTPISFPLTDHFSFPVLLHRVK